MGKTKFTETHYTGMEKKKSKVLEYCIDCAFNMPIRTLRLAG